MVRRGLYFFLWLLSQNTLTIVETNLENFLKENLTGKNIVFVPNPGNAGDALIWYGTLALFKKVGLTYRVSSKHDTILSSTTDTIIYGGGGNFVPYYTDCAQFIKSYMHKVKQLIILPHTIRGHKKLLKKLPKNVILFCREYESYNYCKKTVSYPENIFFARDMAFYAPLNRYKKASKDMKKTLFAFRTDSEAHHVRPLYEMPTTNKDVSYIGDISFTSSFEHNLETVHKFLSLIAQYEIVWTDRLHVAIAAFLLGKRVHLFDNSYGKIDAVYKATLRHLDTKKRISYYGVNFKEINVILSY